VIPVVIDTAVLVKVFLEEEDSPRAQSLFRSAAEGSHRLVAPDFLAVEFGNVLWKHVRRSRLAVEEARRSLERFPYEHIAWLPAHVLLPDAFEFAARYAIAVYDGAFLASASLLDVDFVTTDRELHDQVAGDLAWVKLLSEYPLRG